MSSKTPPTTMPTRRKGRRMSQTNGKRMSATRAAGQQTTRRMRKRRSFMATFLRLDTSVGGDVFRVSAGELGFFGEGFVEDR
jgi:hypothetical protein